MRQKMKSGCCPNSGLGDWVEGAHIHQSRKTAGRAMFCFIGGRGEGEFGFVQNEFEFPIKYLHSVL